MQVILDDKVTNSAMLNKLRGIVSRKRLRPDRLLPLVARVMPERRQTIIPDNVSNDFMGRPIQQLMFYVHNKLYPISHVKLHQSSYWAYFCLQLIRTDPETSSEYETSSSAGPLDIPLPPLVERSSKEFEGHQPTTSRHSDSEFIPKRRKMLVTPSHEPTLPPLDEAQTLITSTPMTSASFTDRGILNVLQDLRATATANGFEASSNEGEYDS